MERNKITIDGTGSKEAPKSTTSTVRQNMASDLASLATLKLMQKKPAETLRLAEAAVAIDPECFTGWTALGYACNEMHLWPRAVEAWRRTTELDPRDAMNWHLLGVACLDAGLKKEAEEALRKSIEFDPDHAESWIRLGDLYLGLKAYDEAAQACREAAAKLDPRDNEGKYLALNKLGFALIEGGRPREAISPLLEAAGLTSNPVIWWNLATACELAGDYRQACEVRLHINNSECREARRHLEQGKSGKTPSGYKPVVLSGTVDLKLTPEGKIKICEFNDLWSSGFVGYMRATGKSMIEHVVKPFYRKTELDWSRAAKPWRPLKYPYNEGRLHYTAASIGREGQPDVFANADIGFRALCLFKDYMEFALPDDAREFFPRALALPVTAAPEEAARKVREAFGDDGELLLVLKPCDTSQGNGVEVIKASGLPARMAEIARAYVNNSSGEKDFWKNNLHPNVVIQEYAPSVPVLASDGLWYNGTMRVAFTAVLDPQGNAGPRITFHGAYWKLPPKGLTGEEPAAETAISHSPSKIRGAAGAAFSGRPFSAWVKEDHRLETERQLHRCLYNLLPRITATPEQFFEKTRAMLESDDTAARALGARLATSHFFGNIMALALGDRVEKEFLRLLDKNALRHEDDSDGIYLQHLSGSNDNVRTARQYRAKADAALYIAGRSFSP